MNASEVLVGEALGHWIAAHPEARPICEIHAYWNAKRGDRPAPARSELDPLEIDPRSLPYIFLVDVVEEAVRRFRYRLVGTRITVAGEGEYTGHYMDELLTDENYAWASAAYSRVVDTMTPAVLVGEYATREGDPLWAARLAAPLASDGLTVDCVLGAFHLLDPEARRRSFGP